MEKSPQSVSDNYANVGVGGSTTATVSAKIDRVTVDIAGYAHQLAAIADVRSELTAIKEAIEKGDSTPAIADALFELSDYFGTLKDMERPSGAVVVNVPEIKLPEIKVPVSTIFVTLKIPKKIDLYLIVITACAILVAYKKFMG